jgi:hypothetical protein
MAKRADTGREPAELGPIQLNRRYPLKLPKDNVLRKAWPEAWDYLDLLRRDKSHPIILAVWLSVVRRWSYAISVTDTDPEGAFLDLATFQRVQIELAELLSLVTPEPNREDLAEHMLGLLIRKGDRSPRDARRIVGKWNQRKGRSANRRMLAVRALEIQSLNPKLTWSTIGKRLKYPKAHQRPISETLPAEVRHIKRILRRYGLWDDRRQS